VLMSLAIAIEKGDIEAVRRLLDEGRSPSALARNGSSLLTDALWRGEMAIARALLAAGANPNDRRGYTPIGAAVGNAGAVRMLIEHGADVNIEHGVALFNACLHDGSREVVDLLLCHGARTDLCQSVWVTNSREVFDLTPLMAAAWTGMATIVKKLLKAKADVNAKDAEGGTPLDWAARCRAKKTAEKIIVLLKNAGAKQNNPCAQEPLSLPDFRSSGSDKRYRQALRELEKVTGVKPQRLINEGNDVSGGYAFPMSKSNAKALCTELQDRFLAEGAFVFATTGQIGSPVGDALGVLPTTDAFQVIRGMETSGQNFRVGTGQVIQWLAELSQRQKFRIVGVGSDFIEGIFENPIDDAEPIARSILDLCPDARDYFHDSAEAAKSISKSRRFTLWWD
jgi:hypothetical protein